MLVSVLYYTTFFNTYTPDPLSADLDNVVAVLEQHPSGTAVGSEEGEDLRPTEPDGLEDEHLRGEVNGGNDVGEDAHLVQSVVLGLVAGVEPDDAGDEGVGAKDTSGQGSDLVLGLLGVLAGGGLEDVGAVLGTVLARGWGQRVVRDEAAVVDAPGVVEGYVVLESVAHGHDGDLEGGSKLVDGALLMPCWSEGSRQVRLTNHR